MRMILSQEHRERAAHVAGIVLASGREDLAVELATAGAGQIVESGRHEHDAGNIMDSSEEFGIEYMSGRWLALNAIKAEASRVSGRKLPTGT